MPPNPLPPGSGATPDDSDGFDSGVYQQFGGKSPYTDGTPDFRPQMMPNLLWRDIGSSGLRQYGGWIREEFLRALQGREAARVFREMRDNNPTIGALMFAIHQTMRRIDWREEPPNDTGEQTKYTDFAHSLRYDMSSPWEDFVAEALSMLEYGFAPHEIVYKRRQGRKEPMVYDVRGKPMLAGADEGSSNYDDGLIGIRRIPLRGQETILRWYFDPNGQITGMQQQPWQGPLIDIPVEKLLIFRPIHYKGNPEGRALDPETPIPTPDGWRVIDDLQEGDRVFDECGQIRHVTARVDWEDRPCYKMTFDDGSEIIADENHLWHTLTLKERHKRLFGKARTTKEIAETLSTPSTLTNHAIPWHAPLDYLEQFLPIDPYVFGLWLGDGTKDQAVISCHTDDLEETVALIEGAGYETSSNHNGRAGSNGSRICFTGQQKWGADSPKLVLRSMGVLGNKHVPQAYMRGSPSQRLALLAGLMDSDGYVDRLGRCQFTNCDYGLITAVAELVRSLGSTARVLHKRKSGEHNLDKWEVTFLPRSWVPFRLSRKVNKCRTSWSREYNYIRNVEPVASRRTVCVEVDSPSHLFIVGEAMITTHNSILRNCYRPYFFSKRIEEEEAILFERMNGIPVLHVPASLLESAALSGPAGAAAAQLLAEYKKIITNIRIDEQMGVIIPSDTFEGPNGPTAVRRFELELLTPKGGGGHTVDSDKVLHRYSLDMLKTAMADFIDLGHQARGTQNLAISKVDMFFQAISGWLTSMAVVMNRYMLPRVWALNGWSNDTVPQYVPDLAQRIDLDVIGNFILRLSQAGARMFPDDNLENYLREAAGMPDLDDEADYRPLQELVNPASQVVTQPGQAATTAGPRGASGVKKPGGARVRGTPTGGAGAGGPFGKNNATAGGAVADAILYEVAKAQRRERPPYRVQGKRGRVKTVRAAA